MALVDDHHIIFGEVIQQTERACSCSAPIEVARVVLNAGAVAKLLNHLEVVLHALLDSLCFNLAPLLLEKGDALTEVEVYIRHGFIDSLLGCNKQICREYRYRI